MPSDSHLKHKNFFIFFFFLFYIFSELHLSLSNPLGLRFAACLGSFLCGGSEQRGRTPARPQLAALTAAYHPFRCPMVSLSYLPRMASASLPYGGILAGTLEGACFWEQKAGNSYRPHHLLLEPGGCIDIQTEINTRHCLATYRPSM